MSSNRSRRNFLQKSLVGAATLSLAPNALLNAGISGKVKHQSKPWIELSAEAYFHNALQISRMTNGKPVMAVLKNNAYGLGAVEVAQILERSGHIMGMAVVKDEIALSMRRGGVKKPILLMGDFDHSLADELVGQKITLSVHSKYSLDKIVAVSSKSNIPIDVALYIDTGLGRMGIPYEQTLEIAQQIQQLPSLRIAQTFSTLTSPKSFAIEQIARFQNVVSDLERHGIKTGIRHLAPSYSLLDLTDSHQDAVRPGILLHGSYPLAKMQEAAKYPLKVPYRLRAPLIRLEKLKAGDTIGFSRFYKIQGDEWIATLPIGWADGYYSGAENGAKVLIGNELFPVVNVNASHTNVSLGSNTNLKIGDVATLIGPDKPEITPEGFANLTQGHNYLQINYKESITKLVYETF